MKTNFFWLFCLLSISACERHRNDVVTSVPEPQAVSVLKVQAVEDALTESVPGTVRPKLRATIEAKVPGTIDKILVAEGSRVKQDEPLAILNVNEIQAKLEQAVAVQQQAKRDYARFESLLKKKATTQQEFEAVQARTQVANAAVREAETMLGYARITAPFDGLVTRKMLDVGDLASPGRPLFEIEDPSTMRFEADLSESLVSRLSPGQTLKVSVSGSEEPLEGRISELAPVADASSRTVRVKIDLPVVSWIRSGSFGAVSVPLRNEKMIRVPAASVITRGQLEYVFIADGNSARLRLVRSGRRFGNELELLSGLDDGESVVVENAGMLSDGQPLEIAQ